MNCEINKLLNNPAFLSWTIHAGLNAGLFSELRVSVCPLQLIFSFSVSEHIATLSTWTGIAEPFLLLGEGSGNNYKLLMLNHSGKS